MSDLPGWLGALAIVGAFFAAHAVAGVLVELGTAILRSAL